MRYVEGEDVPRSELLSSSTRRNMNAVFVDGERSPEQPSQHVQEDLLLPDSSEKIAMLRNVIDVNPHGPISQSTHKRLADLCFKVGREQEAIFHLSESHASTLRYQACQKLMKSLKNLNASNDADLENMKQRLAFKGKWHGVDGLQRRLAELPSEWTVVQLTLEDDPLSRIPPRNRNVNRGLGIYISRLPCGIESTETSDNKDGGRPFTFYLPAFNGNGGEMTLTAAMRKHLEIMSQSGKEGHHPPGKEGRSKRHDKCSLGIQGTVSELENWLSGWQSLFLGKLVDKQLQLSIQCAVDHCIVSYESRGTTSSKQNGEQPCRLKNGQQEVIQDLSDKALQLLYILASSHQTNTIKQIFEIISSMLFDKNFAKYLTKEILTIKNDFSSQLLSCKRYPVVLVVDEDLDILPFEVIESLQDQPATRMPSIHFLHALYCFHKNTTLKAGVNIKNGFYVVNPSNDLPRLESVFKSMFSNGLFQHWKGILSRPPTQQEFLKGLQDSDVFLYCGHGGGNQFISRDTIEHTQIKAVAFLLGCSSSSMSELGGRVEMTSVYNSYLVAASPCVVGMLWPVLDEDVNAMTEKILKVWNSPKHSISRARQEINDIQEKLNKLQLHDGDREESTPNLCEAVLAARKVAARFLNKAAIVVRGLPVWAAAE